MKSTRRGSDSPVHRREKTPRFQIPLDKWPVRSHGHWTTREVPKDQILKEENYLNKYSIQEGRPGNQGTKESGNQAKKENGQLDEEEGEGGEEEMMKMLVTSSNETKKQKAGL